MECSAVEFYSFPPFGFGLFVSRFEKEKTTIELLCTTIITGVKLSFLFCEGNNTASGEYRGRGAVNGLCLSNRAK